MSDIEKLFLAAYPLWPKQLLEKFSSLLSLEVAKFNPEINPQIVDQYKSIRVNQKIKINPYSDNASYLLNPKKSSEIAQVYYGRIGLFVSPFREGIGADYPPFDQLSQYRWYQGVIYFDKRLYKTVNPVVDIEYENNGPIIDYSYLSVMSYSSMRVQPVIDIAFIEAYTTLNEFNGAKSVLAMIENGVSVDVDQKLLTEFVAFLNAYNKYSGELAAANSLQTEKNRQTMTDYKNSINEKINSRKNELNDLRTQISFAAKNETASAKRDMQNLTLSAQSLMLQLQDKLK